MLTGRWWYGVTARKDGGSLAVRRRGPPPGPNRWMSDKITSWGADCSRSQPTLSPRILLLPRLHSRPWLANNKRILSLSRRYGRGHVHHALSHACHCSNRLERVNAAKRNLDERYLSVFNSLSCCHWFIPGILRALLSSLEDSHMLDMSVLRMYIPQLGCEALR